MQNISVDRTKLYACIEDHARINVGPKDVVVQEINDITDEHEADCEISFLPHGPGPHVSSWESGKMGITERLGEWYIVGHDMTDKELTDLEISGLLWRK